MTGPTVATVDARLAELLDGFGPGEATARQRAEDLVASALTLYGGALRRSRQLLDEHGAAAHLAVWTDAHPLGDLLALHRADTPTPPPIDADATDRAAASVERILDQLDAAPAPVRERSVELLTAVTDLHGHALAQLVGAVDDRRRPPGDVLAALGRDDLVASLLLVHGVHPEALDARLQRTLAQLQRHTGASATLELVSFHDGVANLRVEGDTPGDAHRLRLAVERALEREVPDLVFQVHGGTEPVRASTVVIPVESVTVRRASSSTSAEASP